MAAGVSGTEGDLVQIQLMVTDMSGVATSTVEVGEPFQLRALVQDLRTLPAYGSGVFAAYLDVIYTELASVTGPIGYGADFPNVQLGDTSVAGLLDNIGAVDDLSPDATGGSLVITEQGNPSSPVALDDTDEVDEDGILAVTVADGVKVDDAAPEIGAVVDVRLGGDVQITGLSTQGIDGEVDDLETTRFGTLVVKRNGADVDSVRALLMDVGGDGLELDLHSRVSSLVEAAGLDESGVDLALRARYAGGF